MDEQAKRRLSQRNKPNHVLFPQYYQALKLKLAPSTYEQYTDVLDKFKEHLGEYPASEELAIAFLSSYDGISQATLVRYTNIVRGFLKFIGEDISFRPKRPKPLPQYVRADDVRTLLQRMTNKKTHKKTVARDVLLVKLACLSGLRRSELANLKTRDVLLDRRVIIVRSGKGQKDRAVPLHPAILSDVENLLRYRRPDESVFGLGARSITDKISTFAKKAGVELHTHSLRHHFAEALVDANVPITDVKALLGHENLETTSVYLGLRPSGLQEAVDRLDAVKDLTGDAPDRDGVMKVRIKDDGGITLQGSVSTEKIGEALARIFKLEMEPELPDKPVE